MTHRPEHCSAWVSKERREVHLSTLRPHSWPLIVPGLKIILKLLNELQPCCCIGTSGFPSNVSHEISVCWLQIYPLGFQGGRGRSWWSPLRRAGCRTGLQEILSFPRPPGERPQTKKTQPQTEWGFVFFYTRKIKNLGFCSGQSPMPALSNPCIKVKRMAKPSLTCTRSNWELPKSGEGFKTQAFWLLTALRWDESRREQCKAQSWQISVAPSGKAILPHHSCLLHRPWILLLPGVHFFLWFIVPYGKDLARSFCPIRMGYLQS